MPPLNKESLKKRMQDEMRGIGPAFPGVRTSSAPHPPEEESSITITDLPLPTSIRVQLEKDINEHDRLGRQRRELEKQQTALTTKVKKVLDEYVERNQVKFTTRTGTPVNYFPVPRKSIKPELLREQGVSQAKIDAATVTTIAKTLLIGERGPKS